MAVEQASEGSKVCQLVEAVQEKRLEHRVGGKEPETEDECDPDPLSSCSMFARETPCAGGKEKRDADEEERERRRSMPGASEGVG
jgi:hypothetical protein